MKMNPAPFIIIVFVLVASLFSVAGSRTDAPTGRVLFERNCKRCHGADGTKGFLGAKDLQKSRLQDSALMVIISKGGRVMPAWEKKLSREQIGAVIGYIKTLRLE